MTLETATDVPAHIPSELVRDFDMFNPEGWEQDPHLAWKRVQDTHPDIFWTPRYGGHWVTTRYADMKHINENWREFSSEAGFIPQNVIPRQFPVQLDPPKHTDYRRLMMPYFLPKAIKQVQDVARATAIDLIDKIAAKGECEFVEEFSGVMPIIAFLTLVGQPIEDGPYLRSTVVRHNSPDSKDGWQRRMTYVRDAIAARRAHPREGDLVTDIINGIFNGEPIPEEDVFDWSLLILGGGLDTVVSMTSFIARFLADNPEHCRWLIDHPEKMQGAIEELVRRFGTSNLTRQVVDDMDYKGIAFRKGDLVLMPFPLTGLDERVNPDPLTVDFARKGGRHCNFGTGPHTCVGAVLARSEIRIFLEEWLKRIPNFRIKEGTHPISHTGIVNNAVELWLEWDPATVRHVERDETSVAA